MPSFIKRLFNSPTLNTWFSLGVQSLNLFLVTPMLLTIFNSQEIAVWYLFLMVISFQNLLDFGFGSTFSRFISYSRSENFGLVPKDKKEILVYNKTTIIEFTLLSRVIGLMTFIYKYLLIIFLFILLIFSFFLYRPINLLNQPAEGWYAWVFILTVTLYSFWGEIYVSFLIGLNNVSQYYRITGIFSSLSNLFSMLILIFIPSLLNLVIINQSTKIIRILTVSYICKNKYAGIYKKVKKNKFDKELFAHIWPSSWRSAIGRISSYSLIQLSGLFYAQVGSSQDIANYLFSIKIFEKIRTFSQAPFYSKIPKLAKLYSDNKLKEQLEYARKGMIISYWVYIFPIFIVIYFGNDILGLISANAKFVSLKLLSIFSIAFLFERFGAMHIQLISTTNKIFWHIANGVSGIVFIVFSSFYFEKIGITAFALGYFFGYTFFYAPYCSNKVYKEYKTTFLIFERNVFIPPAVILLIIVLFGLI